MVPMPVGVPEAEREAFGVTASVVATGFGITRAGLLVVDFAEAAGFTFVGAVAPAEAEAAAGP